MLFSNLAGVKLLAAQEDHIPFSVTTGLDVRNPETWNEFGPGLCWLIRWKTGIVFCMKLMASL